MKVIGIAGYKNSGKTTLTERLVAHFVGAGLSVSTLKHAHHVAEVDHPGTDSYRHRAAGARQVLLSAGGRWALMTELRGADEPALGDLLSRLDPVDLVLVEGWKGESHPKIEVWRPETGAKLLAPTDPTVLAVASTVPVTLDRPTFHLDDITGIAGLIRARLGLPA